MPQYKVHELICRADINVRYSQFLAEYLPRDSYGFADREGFLSMLQQNAFFNAVNMSHTLLATRYKENELRIRPFLEKKIKDEQEYGFKNSTEELEKGMHILLSWMEETYPNFHNDNEMMLSIQNESDILTEIRRYRRNSYSLDVLSQIEKEFSLNGFNKIRNSVTAHSNRSSPQPGQMLPIEITLISKLCNIVKRMYIEGYFWFDYVPSNHYEYILEEHKKAFGLKKT